MIYYILRFSAHGTNIHSYSRAAVWIGGSNMAGNKEKSEKILTWKENVLLYLHDGLYLLTLVLILGFPDHYCIWRQYAYDAGGWRLSSPFE